MQIKQSTAFRVPIKLRALTDGSALTFRPYTAVTCYIQKQAGSSAAKTVLTTDWFEVDPVYFPGVYDLLLSTTETDTTGFLKYSVSVPGSTLYTGLLEVVSGTVSDVASDVAVLRKHAEGRWKIFTSGGDNNRLVVFDSDGTTPLIKFDLKDSTGAATTTAPYERVKV